MNLQKQKRWLKRNVLWLILLAIIIRLFSLGAGIIIGTLAADKPEAVLATVTEEPAFYQIVTESEPIPSEESEWQTFTESEPIPSEESEWQTFTATAYCSCEKCCGKYAKNRPNGLVYTASGEIAEEGVTIAADWEVLPPGTEVEIDGMGTKIVHDKGSAIKGNRIDIYFSSHQEALNFGVQEVRLRVLDKKESPSK
jgi:3D (Asp-Asp-Asp) domain-containing protein